MKKEKKRLSLKNSFYFILIAQIVALSVLILASLVLVIIHSVTHNDVFLFIMFGLIILVAALFIFFFVYSFRWQYKVFYQSIYLTTCQNVDSMNKDKISFNQYPRSDIEEIGELNEKMNNLSKRFDNAYLVTYAPDYSSLNLEYIDKEHHLITYDSFKKNLSNLIFLSQSFRNVVIEIYFELEGHSLTIDDNNYLLDLYFKAFSEFDNSLFTFNDKTHSLLIYLPVIDSFSRINEILYFLIKESSVITKTIQGTGNVPARYSIVAYPYSSEDSILSDLRYAKRQGKVVNFFLPNRVKNNVNEEVMMHTSMNINYMSRIMSSLSTLDSLNEDDEKNYEHILFVLNDLTKYLDIEESGIILLDDTINKYHCYVTTEDGKLFKKGEEVQREFIDTLSVTTDDDNSYYFSRRSHANLSIGRMLDYYGIKSGFFFAIRKNKKVIGLIYFFNMTKDFVIDAYLRETFFILSLRLAHHFQSKALLEDIDLMKSESEYIMQLGNHFIYNIDDDFRITSHSLGLKNVFPRIKNGEYCFKCLFGLDGPCRDCPIHTFKKKRIDLKNKVYEASLTLNDRKSHNRYMLIERKDKEEEYAPDLYNKDLLVYSFASLVNTLRDAYYSRSRGYLVLLCLDNIDKFIASQGSEGALFSIRCFIKKIKDKLKTVDVYSYNPSTIGILFPLIGHADVITKCEEIYEISKGHFLDDGSEDQFTITYLPLAYPRGYATAEDFLRHANEFYISDKIEHNLDFIYFFDHSISRSASKREFMVSVIREEFSGKMSQSVNLQPMIRGDEQRIYGAEILLRINDAHRNVFFSAQEISQIALQENMTHLITESIVNYVGSLYKEYGPNVFKINGFKRVAINIDETYLKNPNLVNAVIEIHNANKFPQNFLSFEIPEEMILDNMDKIRNFAKELAGVHIVFSCDRYSGRYVGVEKLKELGFKEIKIMKNVIDNIDKDPVKLKDAKELVQEAKSIGLGISVVGVENETQYQLLKEMDKDMMMQGFYFYKPLTRSDLIAALISYEK